LAASIGPTVARSSLAEQPIVLPVSQIPVARAAAVLRRLFPAARFTVEPNANAIIVLAPPSLVPAIQGVLTGIDVRSPVAPAVDAVALQFLTPREAVAHLRPLFPAAHIEAGPHRTLLLRATPQQLAQIHAILASLDVAPAAKVALSRPGTSAEAFHLMQASSRDVARYLAAALPGARVSIAGGSVIVVGSNPAIVRARKLVAELDVPPAGTRFTQVYRIRTIDAGSVADLLRRSFPDITVTVDKEVNALSVVATSTEQRRIADAIAQLDTATSSAYGGGTANPAITVSGNGFEIYTLRAALPGLNGNPSTTANDIASTVTQALSASAPDLHITVSATSQQLILTGSPGGIAMARDLIGQLDVAQKLVVLDTQILEIDETVAKDLGLSFPTPVVSSTFSEVVPTDANGNTLRIGRLQAITRTPLSLPVQLNLLVSNGTARVLADPRITTVSGRTATIRAGDTIAIETTAGGGAGTVATTQIQTFQTGVTLDITPIVNADNYVSVTLHPSVNSETGILNGIPQISTRDTQTTVALQEDQTLIIGGLIQQTDQRNYNKIPFLGDLPLIGSVFRENVVNGTRNELIITVTPHIVVAGDNGAFHAQQSQRLVTPPPMATLMTPAPLPTLPPTAQLPAPRPALTPAPFLPPATIAQAPPLAPPVVQSTPPQPATGVAPAGSSPFPNLNTFTYGSVPQNNFAKPTDPVQIFYATFSPTVLSRNAVVTLNVITTTNAQQATLTYGTFTQQLTQTNPGQWQAHFQIAPMSLPAPPANVSLTLSAARTYGSSQSIAIPVSVTP
jgi:type II secretory pathway component GspD/PulD (secretin)